MKLIHKHTIARIRKEYKKSKAPWIIGFSGGKDSTALLKLVYLALRGLRKREKIITVFYCDTGIEIPLMRKLAYKTLHGIRKEALSEKIPINIRIVKPKMKDRFFVNVIGKGYPPPTNKFRWCTDRLRINPSKGLYKDRGVILLGVRNGESQERDKIISKHKIASYYYKHVQNSRAVIFSPIVNYETQDVWDLLLSNGRPNSIDGAKLASLYSCTGTVQKGSVGRRFGCWVCTVVRKDRAMEGLVNEGVPYLEHLLSYRNWLMQIREQPSYRFKKRRNGVSGMGSFTLLARREMLSRLLKTQRKLPWKLTTKKEVAYIKKIWQKERVSISI